MYEYGGGPYDVLPASADEHYHQRIIFSDAGDGNALKLLDVDSATVTTLVSGKEHLRYADFGPHPHGGATCVLAIEEDHTDPLPAGVRNYVVSVDVRTGEVTRLAADADFYTTPRFSPDGRWVSWRAWDHPEMPWTESRLYLAEVVVAAQEGPLAVGQVRVVAGGRSGECVGESAWGLDGALYFSHEDGEGDWRQLWRVHPDRGAAKEKLRLDGLEDVEIGDCSMLIDW